jgi:hypothetical protein
VAGWTDTTAIDVIISKGGAMGWDKELTQKLMDMGFTRDQAGLVVGIVAEERQIADRQGYKRGYNDGHGDASLSRVGM